MISPVQIKTLITYVTLYLGNVFFLSWLPSSLPPSRSLPSSSRTPLPSNYPHTAPIISALPPQMGPVRQRLLAGRRWGVWASSGRVDACVREPLSHIPPAAGSAPAVGRGFASFSRPLRFLSSSGSYSFPARKQPFPCNCRRGREREKEREWEKEGCIASPELGTAIPVLKS